MINQTRLVHSGYLFLLVLLCSFSPLYAQQPSEQMVTLNMKDADIRAFIEMVSSVTGTNFVIDPRVNAKVTVISSQPLPADAVYQVFLSVLQVHGLTAIQAGDLTKITPEVEGKQTGISDSKTQPAYPDDMLTQVVRVKNVPAAQLVPILRPLVPQYGHLASYPPANVVVIADRRANVERMVNLIKQIDDSGEQEVDVVALENANAVDAMNMINQLNKSGKRMDPTTQGLTIVPDMRTNSIYISGTRTQRLRIRALLQKIDSPLESQGNTQVIYLNHARATNIQELLAQYTGAAAVPIRAAVGEAGGKTLPMQHQDQGKQDVIVLADDETNALVVSAPPEIMKEILTIIARLDIRRAQVMVEAIIAEVATTNNKQVGFQWFLDGSDKDGPVGFVPFGENDNLFNLYSLIKPLTMGGDPATVLGNAAAPPLGLTIGGGRFQDSGINFGVLLRAMAADSSTNILSTPTLITLDNQEAEISVGQEVPFRTGGFLADDGGGDPFQTIERNEVGIKLKIVPQISAGNTVRLQIEQEASQLVAAEQLEQASDLVTSKRTINTHVVVEDGEIIALGGLIKDHASGGSSKIPLLGDIPVVGRLFRYDNAGRNKSNLMVFLRPVIIRNGADSTRYSRMLYEKMRNDQLNQKLRSHPRLRGMRPPVLPESGQQFPFTMEQ